MIVPSGTTFSVCEIYDDIPIMATDKNIDLPETDWNKNKIQRNKETGFLKLEN